MAKKVKKLSRKELLKEDEFLTSTRSFVRYLFEKKSFLILGFGGIIALALIFVGVRYLVSSTGKEAQNSLAVALEYYKGPVVSKEMIEKDPRLKYFRTFSDEKTKYTEAAAQFDAVSKSYKRKPSGIIALYYAGNCFYKIGDYETAANKYQEYIDRVKRAPDKSFSNFALEGLGYSLEMSGNTDGALAAFEKLAVPESGSFKERGLYNAARIYQIKNNNQKALELYKTLVQDFPESKRAQQVKMVISQLEEGT